MFCGVVSTRPMANDKDLGFALKDKVHITGEIAADPFHRNQNDTMVRAYLNTISASSTSSSSSLRNMPEKKNIMIAFCNKGYVLLAFDWYVTLKELGYTEHWVIAIDIGAEKWFKSRDPSIRVELYLTELGAKFMKLWRSRLLFIDKKLSEGYNVLVADVDNHYERHIDFDTFADNDVSFMEGSIWPMDVKKKEGFVLCPGMSYWKASQQTIDLVRLLILYCGDYCDDQVVINRVVMNYMQMSWKDTNDENSQSQRIGISAVNNMKIQLWNQNFAWRGTVGKDKCPDMSSLWVYHPIGPKLAHLKTSDLKHFVTACKSRDSRKRIITTATNSTTPTKIFDQKYCENKYRSRKYLENNQSRIPPVLYTFPGSGNTWTRLLVEYGTGVYTGSIYDDFRLVKFLPGETKCDSSVSVIKAHIGLGVKHPLSFTYNEIEKDKYTLNLKSANNKCLKSGITTFCNAIFIVRDPFAAIWSQYQLQRTNSHSGIITTKSFDLNSWRNALRMLAVEYLNMLTVDYPRMESVVGKDNVVFIRYEDLVNVTTRTKSLKEIIRATGLQIFLSSSSLSEYDQEQERLECAFKLSVTDGTRRSPINGETRMTAAMAYAHVKDLVCEFWMNLQPTQIESRFKYTLPQYMSSDDAILYQLKCP